MPAIVLAICIMAFSDPSLGQSYLIQMAVGAVLLGFSAAVPKWAARNNAPAPATIMPIR
jgi:hypothetical protein